MLLVLLQFRDTLFCPFQVYMPLSSRVAGFVPWFWPSAENIMCGGEARQPWRLKSSMVSTSMKTIPTYSIIATLALLTGPVFTTWCILPSPLDLKAPFSYLLRMKFSRLVASSSSRRRWRSKPLGSFISRSRFTCALPRLDRTMATSLLSHVSACMESTVEMCVPILRCTPAQRMQISTPWLTAAQSGCRRPQSAHMSFPFKRRSFSTGVLMSRSRPGAPGGEVMTMPPPSAVDTSVTAVSGRRFVTPILKQHDISPASEAGAAPSGRLATARSTCLLVGAC
mmetsp:Transcript_12829/g.37659  ORF Transcript_12829/g.37659 Transcript_12829/m.37659 type:complete len:282 (-) Transcript_12829:17-862(-)